MRVVNRSLLLSPPIADTKKQWLDSLLSVINAVVVLPRPKPVADVFVSAKSVEGNRDYQVIMERLDYAMVKEGFSLVETLISQLRAFTSTWLSNQVLWRMNTREIAERLGDIVQLWHQLLTSLIASKKEISSTSVEHLVGCVHVNLEQIQAALMERYDALHKELLSSFAKLVLAQTNTFVSTLRESRNQLEKYTVSTSTHEAITLILVAREVERNLPLWKRQYNSLVASQQLLTEQHFAFPPGWVFETQLENDWDSLQQIFSRRQESITKSKDQLKKSVQEEDANIQRAMSELIHSWEQKRPLSGTIAVANARAVLVEFQTQMQSLSDKWEKVNQGRDALKLDVYIKNPLELMQTCLLYTSPSPRD